MKITCQACAAKYTIADDKVRGKTVKIKCKKCGASIVASGKEGEAGGLAPAGATGGAPSEIFWTVNVGEGDQRSVGASDIANMLASGEVNSESYAWRDGMTDWLPLSQVPELASIFSATAAPESSAAYDDPAGREIDEDMPTKMERGAAMLDMAPVASPAAAPPSSGAFDTGPSPFAPTQPHTQAPAPAARAARAAPAGGDLFAPRALEPAPAPAPLRPGNIINDEASGLIDIRNLSASLGANQPPKPGLPQKNALDDVMGLGGAPLFSPAPLMAPPDLNAPPPPPPPSSSFAPAAPMGAMGAASAQPGFSAMPAPPAQKKTSVGLIIGVLGLVLAAGGIGAFVMSRAGANAGNAGDTPATASADTKTTQPAATADSTASAAASVAMASPTSTIPTTAPEGAADKADTDKAAADKGAADKADTGAKTADKKHDDKAAADKKKKEDEDKKKADEKKKEEEAKKKEEEAKKKAAEAAPPAGGGSDAPIDRGALMSAMSKAASTVGSCKTADGPTGSGRVSVTFAPSGRVTQAVVNGSPFAGTSVGSCVASRFRGVSIPAFAGSSQTVGKSFQIN
jgi:predicted Zn finger-like uncharacterized protein